MGEEEGEEGDDSADGEGDGEEVGDDEEGEEEEDCSRSNVGVKKSPSSTSVRVSTTIFFVFSGILSELRTSVSFWMIEIEPSNVRGENGACLS